MWRPVISAQPGSTSRSGIRSLIGRGVELSVAAFGKHPGWNDHIDDLGLDTQRLVDFKRKLYIDGIGACVESGRWDTLEPDNLLPGYGHIFIYRGGGDLIVGRMWSSADGKGRSKYPMVLCVHMRGIGLEEALPMVLPALERTQARCEAGGTAVDVVRAVSELGDTLRGKAALLPPRRSEARPGGSVVRELADHASLGPGRRGFHRVMYQMDRELVPFLLGGQSTTRSRSPDLTARHLRVPSCWNEPSEVFTHWMGLLSLRLEPVFPLMMILPLGRGWLDVIVGEPSGPELFCIRASSKLVPPVSEVPYTIEPDQAFRYEHFVRDAASKAEVERAAAAQPAGDARPNPRTHAGTASGWNKLLLALVLAALLLGSVAWLVFGQPSKNQPGPKPSVPTTGKSGQAPSSSGRGVMRLAMSGVAIAVIPASSDLRSWSGPVAVSAVVLAQPEALRAREEIVQGSATINAFWRTQRDRLLDFYRGTDGQDLAAHAQRLEQALVDLDRRTPAALDPAHAAGWVAALSDELGRRREVAFEQVFAPWRGQTIDPADEVVRQALDAARVAGVRDAESMARLAAELGLIEVAMQHGIGLETPLSGGASANSIVNRWESGGLLRDRGVRVAVAPVLDRVQALREIAVEGETARLLDRVRPPAAPSPEVAVAVWRRLSSRPGIPWPATADDLAVEADLGRQLRALLDRFPDQARAATLREELAAEQKRRLIRMLTTADEPSEFDAAAAAVTASGLRADEFEPRLRFNLMLHEFKVKLEASAPELTDAETVRLARQFVDQARALPAGTAFLADAASTISAVDSLGSRTVVEEPGIPTAFDPSGLGPGATGRYLGHTEGKRLIFAPIDPNAPAGKLEFVRIDPDPTTGATPFYLGTTEVSVEMFVLLARNSGQRGALAALLPAIDPASDPRLGPRTWEWDARQTTLLPARQWLTSSLTNPSDQYALGDAPPRPSIDAPMQYLTPQAAVSAAAWAGCRLPTPAEWKAICAQLWGDLDLESSNLRDQTWDRHRAFVDRQLASGKNVQPAAAGSFDRGVGGVSASDDGVLWLSPVAAGVGDFGPQTPSRTSARASEFHHIRGNVAEYLAEVAGTESPKTAGTPSATEPLAATELRFSVAGGSALASTTIGEVPVPLDMNDAAEGFADVGFRLAFSARQTAAQPNSLRGALIEALTPTPYLRPR